MAKMPKQHSEIPAQNGCEHRHEAGQRTCDKGPQQQLANLPQQGWQQSQKDVENLQSTKRQKNGNAFNYVAQ